MTNKLLPIVLILTASLLATGCVGKREINDLALVMAVGVDKGKEGKTKVTVQVARPADARGQTGAPSGNTGDPVWSANAEGKTIFEAIRNLATFSTRRVFWAHNYIIVINEDLARDGIHDVIDFFTRNPELRMNTWVVVTPDKAEDIVSTLTGIEVMPGEALDKLFRYTPVSAQAPRTKIRDLFSAYLSNGTEPILARMKLIDRGVSNKKAGQAGSVQQVELAGAGIFKGDRLVGTLNAIETKNIQPFIEDVESRTEVLECPTNKKEKVSIEIRHPKLKVIPEYKKGKPVVFHVELTAYSNIVEAGCPISLEDEESLKQLENQLKKRVENEMEQVIQKLQNEFNADVLHFGKVFNNRFPAEWKEIKGDWEEHFKAAKVDVQVDARVRSTPLYYRSLKKDSD